MKKVYLVDSENVGDIWVPLLVSTQPEDDVLVFYTLKSPHMNYENVRLLTQTEKEAVFIKCFEGNNALDFQLVSELGYRLCADSDAAYIIVSNDTGFDAVVRYWSAKDCPVSRMNGKDCRRMLQELKREGRTAASEAVAEDEEEPFDDEVCVLEDAPETAEHAEDGSTEQEDAHGADMSREPAEHDKIVEALCSCISKENLVDFHNALVAFLGEEEGKALYQEMKNNAPQVDYWSVLPKKNQKEKFEIYCELVFACSEPAEEAPEDFADFLYRSNAKRNNLNSLRAALQGHYGKDKGLRYYSLFKSHIKIMNRM